MGMSILRGQKFIGIQEPKDRPTGLTNETLYLNEDHQMIEIKDSQLSNFYKPPQATEENNENNENYENSMNNIKETLKENIETDQDNNNQDKY